MIRVVTAIAIAVVSFGACSDGAEPVERMIEISIRHSAFEPETLQVERGTEVTFVLRNTDPIDHEFIVGDAGVQDVHERGTEAHHGAKPGEVSIPAGATRRTTYVFDTAGTLIYGCHLPGHYDYGMRGTVEVT